MNKHLAVIVLFISAIGWGFAWLPIKSLNEMGLDNMHLIFIAFTSGTVVLSPWLFKQYVSWKQSIGFMVLIGLAGGFANASFQTAIFYGDVIRVMILFYLLPVWSILGGWLFLKEDIDRVRLIAVIVCLLGAFVILDVWHVSWQGINWVDGLAIGAGMALAATNILFRFTQHIPLMSKVTFSFIGCTVIMGGFLITSTATSPLPHNGAIPWVIAYGAIWLTLITIGTQWAVTRMEAGRSAIILVMELVVAVVSVALLTSAELKIHEMIGGLMVISAALLESSRNDDESVPKVSDRPLLDVKE